ncbi:MAG: Fructose-1,6-bisphosphatase/inositol-1-monophosphatase [Opitutia bacterium UBA7350]|nr:MAG: Fructose-1,6-bisphosphatase/inositol-1-monophosphatase [Opitutae bacterium UBA7350]
MLAEVGLLVDKVATHGVMNIDQTNGLTERLNATESILPDLEQFLLNLQAGDFGIETKTNAFDLVTEGDLASQARLTEFISERFSGDQIISEEASASTATPQEGFCWVLDPIDGTTNFANRIPIWAISIGLLYDGQTVGGIVSGPGLGLRYRGALGQGASCNGKPIHVNKKPSLGSGVVVTGFPYDRARRAEPLSQALANMLREAGGVRRLGAAALDFCFVADGRFVGYYEMSLKPWDAAAGVVIAREAGATLSNMSGGTLDIFKDEGTVVTNGIIHDALLAQVGPMLDALALGAST